MKIYVPVEITTQEQIDALPHDAIVLTQETQDRFDLFDGNWWSAKGDGNLIDHLRDGYAVLVLKPIEAEEESSRGDSAATIRMLRERGDAVKTRYTTPWEES